MSEHFLLRFESGPVHNVLTELPASADDTHAAGLHSCRYTEFALSHTEGLTMSVYDPLRDSSARPAGSTRFDYAVDDADNPTELNVFSEQDDELPTHWISVDIEHAVALDEMR